MREGSSTRTKQRVYNFLAGEAFRGPALLTAGALVAQLLTGVAGALMGRAGGPLGLGVVATVLGVVAVCSDVSDFGTGTYIPREVANLRLSLPSAIGALRQRFVVCGMIAILGVCGAAFAYPNSLATILSGGMYLMVSSWNLSISGVARATGRWLDGAIAPVIDRGLFLTLTAYFYIAGNLTTASFIGTMAATGAASSLYLHSRLGVWKGSPSGHSLRSLYAASRHLGISGIATDLAILEAPLITLGASPTAAGLYSAGVRLSSPLALPGAGSGAVILRAVSRTNRDRRAVLDALKSQRYVVISVAFIATLCAFFGKPILHIVFGDSFGSASLFVYRVVLLTTVVSLTGQLFYWALIAQHLEKRASVAQWVCVPAGLMLTFIGALYGGARLAVLGGLAGQVTQAAWLAASCRSVPGRHRMQSPQRMQLAAEETG